MVADNQVEIRIGYFLNTKEKKNYLQVSYDSSLHNLPSELLQQIKSVACSRAQVWKGIARDLYDYNGREICW
jgi:hypothetical protein